MQQMQAQVDVGQFVGQHGTRLHQVPNQGLSTQASECQTRPVEMEFRKLTYFLAYFDVLVCLAAIGEARRGRIVRELKITPSIAVREMQSPWFLLPQTLGYVCVSVLVDQQS